MADSGLLTDADRNALIAVCLEWARYLDATKKVAELGMIVKAPSGYPMPNPYLPIATKALQGCIAHVGRARADAVEPLARAGQ